MVVIGVDYYPEHWDKSLWDSDIDLMVKTGVKVVRIAEFAWSRLEPQENIFEFKWLDEIIDKFTKADLKIILGTPTNCAPMWMYRNYKETLQVEKTGKSTDTGIRGHRCMTNPTFRKFAKRIIEKMATRYKDNKNIIAWQIDNELDSNHCNCEYCTKSFQEFLRDKFKTIDKLNLAYGNDVWSGDYSDFNQITTPLGDKYKSGWLNPSYMLDYERFASKSTKEFISFQYDILKQISPNMTVTTNACFGVNTPDYFDIFKNLDVTSYDNYPSLYKVDGVPNKKQAFILDLVRGFKNQNYWIVEQMSGAFGCWAPISPTPRPGMIKGYAVQAIAHGADLMLNFRWRTSTKGAEMFCHGILDHSNVAGRRFFEFSELCKDINALSIPKSTVVKSYVALVYSYEQEYAFKVQEMSAGFSYTKQVELLYNSFKSYGVNIDVIDENKKIDDYKVVVVPTHFVTNDTFIEKLEKFAQNGGVVILTNRSGVKDKNNACLMNVLPGKFLKLSGVEVLEYDAIGETIVKIKDKNGQSYDASCWCDILKTEIGTDVIAVYDSEFYSQSPAVTRKKIGKGEVYYIGTVCQQEFYNNLAKSILVSENIEHYKNLADGIDITIREDDKQKFTFIFNNNYTEKVFDNGKETFLLKPFEIKIIKDIKRV